MNARKKWNLFGMPAWVILLALFVGLGVGSFDRIRDVVVSVGSRPGAAPTAIDSTARSPPARDLPHNAAITEGPRPAGDPRRPPAVATPMEQDAQIRATEGLVFEVARMDGRFVGFRVISNRDDPRLKAGDIVVSVGGSPVEDSAAGSELFIAALSNRNAAIETYAASANN